MAFMLDTSVVIPLRDAVTEIEDRVAQLVRPVMMSILTRVELEGGVYRDAVDVPYREQRLALVAAQIPSVAFDEADAVAYSRIVAQAGYSRRKLLDRMIAAQALVRRATLVTLNPGDFADVPGLQLVAW